MESYSTPPQAVTEKSFAFLWANVAVCLGLVLVTLAVYAPVRGFDFVNYDDNEYVTENPPVSAGLTGNGIAWAFTHSHSNNWHPLTWLSHMLDCEWWGLNPGFHHVHNVLLHATNAVLLFLLLNLLTGARWRSAFVAALFAWHPLHVESVAWISERKDVLSTFWGLLCLLAYSRFAQESKVGSSKARTFYALSLFCFVLGLLSKPMLVTWPFVLLLLDVWPLGRWGVVSLRRLCVEKVPFLIAAMASSVVTYLVQQASGAMRDLAVVPPFVRVANALKSYVVYLLKMIWPEDLAVYYPLRPVAFGQTLACVIVLVAVSVLVWNSRRTRPWLTFGWCWYVGTLTPVIGLVQVGDQAMADRYTYLPLIGIFIAATWGIAAMTTRLQSRQRWLVTAAVLLVLSACLARTANQLSHWKNSISLFERVLAFSPDAPFARNNLGIAYSKVSRPEEAIVQFQKSLELKPDFADPCNNLGLVYLRAGRYDEAIVQFQKAVQLKPDFVKPYNNLGLAFQETGRPEEALRQFQQAQQLNPRDPEVQYNFGNALVRQGHMDEAIQHYELAVKYKPDFANAHANLGMVLFRQGAVEAAIQHYRAALQWQPNLAQVRLNLGIALVRSGALAPAIEQFEAFVVVQPDNAEGHNRLADALLRSGRANEALSHWETAAQLAPSNAVVLNNLSRLLLTHSDNARRDPARALQLALRACELTNDQDAGSLLTLASALGAASRSDDALKTATLALGLAQSQGRTNQIEEAQQQIKSLEEKLKETGIR